MDIDEAREHYGISKDHYPIPTTKKTTEIGQNNKQRINAAIRLCPECGSTNLVTDHNRAEMVCGDCGVVIVEVMLEENQYIPTIDIPNTDKGSYDPYRVTSHIRLPNPLSYKKESLLNGAHLPSEQDKMISDDVDDVLKEVILDPEIRKSLRDKMIKNVKLAYNGLYGKGFTRLGVTPYRSDMIRILARREARNNKEVRKHHPENITTWIPEKLIGKNLPSSSFRNSYFSDPDEKKREKMYRYFHGTDALLVIYSGHEFGARQGRDMFTTLLLRGREIIGDEIFIKANKRGLNFKTGFMACIAIYTIKALEKHDGRKGMYLKSDKEVIKILGISSTVFKDRMKELDML